MHTLLLTDDEPGLAKWLATLLGRDRPDLRITTEATAAGAIHQIQQQEFDLIITDWLFHGEKLSGADVLRAAKARDPLALAIVISAYMGTKVDRYRDGFEQGAYEVLDKNATGDFVKELQYKTAGALALRDAYLSARKEKPPELSSGAKWPANVADPLRAEEWRPEFNAERSRLIWKRCHEGLTGEETAELAHLQQLHSDWLDVHEQRPDLSKAEALLDELEAKFGPLNKYAP